MGRVELQLPARVVAVVCLFVALVALGLGLGGVKGQHCKDAPLQDLPEGHREARLKAFAKHKRPDPIPPRFDCQQKVLVNIVPSYLSIDTLFLRTPHVDTLGSLRHYRHPAYLRIFSVKVLVDDLVSVGLDNVIFVHSIGIKAAFILLLFTFTLSIIATLSARNLICYQQPNIVCVENLMLALGMLGNGAGGALAGVWGLFFHAQHTPGIRGLICEGWVVGGSLMFFVAIIQCVELIWISACKAPPTFNTKLKKNKKKKKKTEVKKEEDQGYFLGSNMVYGTPTSGAPTGYANVAPSGGQGGQSAAQSVAGKSVADPSEAGKSVGGAPGAKSVPEAASVAASAAAK